MAYNKNDYNGVNTFYLIILFGSVFIYNYFKNHFGLTFKEVAVIMSISFILILIFIYLIKKFIKNTLTKSVSDPEVKQNTDISNIIVKTGEDKGNLWINLDRNKLDYLLSLNQSPTSDLAREAILYQEKLDRLMCSDNEY